MPIETTQRGSRGWQLNRLWKLLAADQPRLERIDQYKRGEPPLPRGADKLKEGYKEFQKKSRRNFAELSVKAVRERLRQISLITPAATGATGDLEAFRIWELLNGPLVQHDCHNLTLHFGRGYVMVGYDNDTGTPIVTAEDPRLAITDNDPRTGARRAGLKVYRDDEAGLDFAHLLTPGEVHVAVRKSRGKTLAITDRFSARQWEWADELPEALDGQGETVAAPDGLSAYLLQGEVVFLGDDDFGGPLPAGMEDVVPLVDFENLDGVGEYELHTDTLDSVNHGVLQRLVVATMQAFRQRALKGDLPEKDDETGEKINYDDLFTADPGALWQLPDGVELWESAQGDLTPLLNAVKADLLHFCAETSTPIASMIPDDAAQSAEGADFQRESLVFRCEDRRDRFTPKWSQVHALIRRYPGKYHDAGLIEVSAIRPIWADVVRRSLSEQANAFAQLSGLPVLTRARIALQAGPAELDTIRAEQLEEATHLQIMAGLAAVRQQQAAPPAAAAEPPAGAPADDGEPAPAGAAPAAGAAGAAT